MIMKAVENQKSKETSTFMFMITGTGKQATKQGKKRQSNAIKSRVKSKPDCNAMQEGLKVKQERARGGCLGTGSRRKT